MQERTPEELIDAVPPVPVKSNVARCDGGGGSLGHPAVYIRLDPPLGHTRGTPVGTCANANPRQ